jgi:hypothetical protein
MVAHHCKWAEARLYHRRMQTIQLLICGTPASSKSTFGQWLAAEKDFRHVDLERPAIDNASLDAAGLRAQWQAFIDGGSAHDFISALKGKAESVVLTWGFPVAAAADVARLTAAGLRMVWFEGDRLATRDLFLSRGEGTAESFDHQFGQIAAQWPRIAPLCGQIVHTVRMNTPPPTMASLFTEIFGRWT